MGKLLAAQMEFCEKRKLMLCVRGHSVFHEDRHYNVYCFVTKAGAETFMQEFGGEWFDPRPGEGRQLDEVV